ncbi:MAG: hypothetical protein H7A24_00405 [Leptospiraceae bacterium]|nr:hypothetical protein [Leptospiraceae bacterium]MCP5510313.1 hypothetical protein [Leptospiraceae bacterium]
MKVIIIFFISSFVGIVADNSKDLRSAIRLYESGKWKESIEILNKIDPKFKVQEIQFWKGKINEKLNKNPDAILNYQNSLSVPKSFRKEEYFLFARDALFRLYRETDQLDSILKDREKYFSSDEEISGEMNSLLLEAYLQKFFELLENKQYSLGNEMYQKYIELLSHEDRSNKQFFPGVKDGELILEAYRYCNEFEKKSNSKLKLGVVLFRGAEFEDSMGNQTFSLKDNSRKKLELTLSLLEKYFFFLTEGKLWVEPEYIIKNKKISGISNEDRKNSAQSLSLNLSRFSDEDRTWLIDLSKQYDVLLFFLPGEMKGFTFYNFNLSGMKKAGDSHFRILLTLDGKFGPVGAIKNFFPYYISLKNKKNQGKFKNDLNKFSDKNIKNPLLGLRELFNKYKTQKGSSKTKTESKSKP